MTVILTVAAVLIAGEGVILYFVLRALSASQRIQAIMADAAGIPTDDLTHLARPREGLIHFAGGTEESFMPMPEILPRDGDEDA